MQNCRDVDSQLAAYVDGAEHPAVDRPAIEAHLEGCPSCRARADHERAARAVVCAGREALRGCAPGSLRQRCAAQRAQAPTSSRRLARRPWVPLSLAASLIFVVGVFLLFGWGSSVETYAAQLAVDHLKCFQFPPEATAAPDVSLIGRDWQQSCGWPLKVAASSAPEHLQLLGVRRCGSTRGRVAHILYRWRGEPLSVYVLNGAIDNAPHAGRDVIRLGEQAIVWADHGRTYAVVASRRLPDLRRVAVYVRRGTE